MWVKADAAQKRIKFPGLLSLFVFIFNIPAFILYLLLRKKRRSFKCTNCGYNLDNVISQTNFFVCPKCNQLIDSDVAHQIFYDKIKHFKSEGVKVFDYEGLPLENVAKGSTKSGIWNIIKFYLATAVKQNASDIHLDPEKTKLRMRQRIDGVLYDIISPPRELGRKLASSLKILAGLDIAKKKEAQSGRFEVWVDNDKYDLRVSTSYSILGEKVTIRLLNRAMTMLTLESLGLYPEDLKRLSEAAESPHGMILICGPTGSGKTTSLYSIIKRLNPQSRNIMTIEDPVEYELPHISQQQVNVKAGISFAAGLRSMLRQDPDVIMIGEIRDAETAQIAHHASDTGHLVLSTMHAIDTAGTINRLKDFGISTHYLANSLLAVISQRLIRVLCEKCKEEIKYDQPAPNAIRNVYRAKGCKYCNYTGFKGRTGIFEILFVDKDVREHIYNDASPDQLRDNYKKWGICTLREQALRKVQEGKTTLQEIKTVVPLAIALNETGK
jgi:type II secretory ATPase GspE/PulE/Tfp pilus assembly ATPase PilB-like protein